MKNSEEEEVIVKQIYNIIGINEFDLTKINFTEDLDKEELFSRRYRINNEKKRLNQILELYFRKVVVAGEEEEKQKEEELYHQDILVVRAEALQVEEELKNIMTMNNNLKIIKKNYEKRRKR